MDKLKLGFVLLCIICLMDMGHLYAQSFTVSKITSSELNINASIYDIEKDHLGFLWVACNSGLFRYDGKNFEKYEEAGHEVSSLAINSSNDLYFYGSRGLMRLSADRSVSKVLHECKEYSKLYALSFNSEDKLIFITKERGVLQLHDDQSTFVALTGDIFQWEQKISRGRSHHVGITAPYAPITDFG